MLIPTIIMLQNLTLRLLNKPPQNNPMIDVFWLCDSFGLNTSRGDENFSAKTLLALLEELRMRIGTSSERLAEKLRANPGRINYHVRAFVDAGLLYREKKLIFIRRGSLSAAVEEMRKDANRIFDDLAEVAQEIDRAMGVQRAETL